jgi:cohesin complex subunit SA-1/2
VEAINSLLGAAALSSTNSTKMTELEDSLAEGLGEAIGDRDIQSSAFEADEIQVLEGCLLRLASVIGTRDLQRIVAGKDGQIGLWATIEAIADRGRLGYREEEKVRLYILGDFFSG